MVFDALGGGAFGVIAAIAALNVLVISVFSVETKGQTLDGVQSAARRRFGGRPERTVKEQHA